MWLSRCLCVSVAEGTIRRQEINKPALEIGRWVLLFSSICKIGRQNISLSESENGQRGKMMNVCICVVNIKEKERKNNEPR